MKLRTTLQRYWPETLLVLALALPWLSLLVLGTLWLWEHGHVWIWATGSAVLALLAWPLMRLPRRHNAAQPRYTQARGARAAPRRRARRGRSPVAVIRIRQPLGSNFPFPRCSF